MKNKIITIYLQIKFVMIAAFFTWITTYLVTRFFFDVKIGNFIQEFELFLTVGPGILLFYGIALFVRERFRNITTIIIHICLNLLLLCNMLFYSFYDDFITLPLLSQSSNLEDLGSSITQLIDVSTFLIFIPTTILFYLYKKKRVPLRSTRISINLITSYFSILIIFFTITLGLAYTQRPELLTRGFDRKELVKGLGLYGYQLYDLGFQLRQKSEKALADSDQLTDTENFLSNRKEVYNKELFGKYKGKNIIIVSLESTQTFAIDLQVNGQPVTPFLNSLKNEMYYFDNHYHQTGQGKTSDAEFLVDNSMYPLGRGAVFFTNSTNTFNATPGILKNFGYTSAVFHANNLSFWNRNIVYSRFGYDYFFNLNQYKVNEANSVGWGLKDKEFFEQSIEQLETLKQPFYTRFITLTNHFPFELSEADTMIGNAETGDNTVDNYLKTLRYQDEALKRFVELLKSKGYWDQSIVVFYGDHYGISKNHNKAMATLLNKDEITSYDHIQLQRTPLYIHLPNQKSGKVISDPIGQIDIRPTLLNLLGIHEQAFNFGIDLFANGPTRVTVLRDGSFITEKYIYTEGIFYDRLTGIEVIPEDADNLIRIATEELKRSDKIITTDLMRFYKHSYDSRNHSTNM